MRLTGLLVGGFLIMAGAGSLAYDLAALAAGRPFRISPMGQIWFDLDSGSLNLAQVVIERYVWAPLWHPGIATVLRWPAAFVLLVPGAVLLLLCWRRRGHRRRRSASAVVHLEGGDEG